MEKKTIGSFIAALRKASGMTQKQLAELLNVSDKAVSRWERDECAPDLALIPVMAEIFGVTSDELLRGERKIAEGQPQYEEKKTEKQLRRVLNEAKSRLQIRSILSLTVALLGLIAAMICNLGFLRAYQGFFLGAAFILVSVVMEAIFLIQAHGAVNDSDFDGQAMFDYRKSMVGLAAKTFSAICVLFAALLPLIIFPWDPYQGLYGGEWLRYGLIFGGISALLCALVSWAVHSHLVKTGFLAQDPKAAVKNKLRKKVLTIGLAVLLFTGLCNWAVGQFTSTTTFAQGFQTFDNWDDFKAYMETPTDYDGGSMILSVDSSIGLTYVTEDGNYVFPEDISEETIEDQHGNVLCSYKNLNLSVAEIHYGSVKDGYLPVTVYTYAQRTQGYEVRSNVLTMFIPLYIVTVIALLVYYNMKVRKL